MKPSVRLTLTVSACAVGAIIGLVSVLALLVRKDETVGLNQPVQYDDFAFSVRDVRSAPSMGLAGVQRTAQGQFYLVDLVVDNRAKRVPFRFQPEIAVIVDAAGHEYTPDVGLSHLGDCAHPLAAGQAGVAQLVYDLPAKVDHPHMRISFGGPVGVFLDSLLLGDKRIDLKPR